jgi:creatinine amidohydrolase
MQWENLTSPDFGEAVRQTGVCIIPLGVLERHSDHLPLGTDFLNSHKLASLAAEKEPAVVFPPFYFGQIYEARCYPGTFTLKPTLLVEVLQAVMDEIGRNGFKKIILLNGHGGNIHLLHFLAQCSLWEEKPYSVYLFERQLTEARQKEWDDILETDLHWHACECETSISLANHPELVKMERVPAAPAAPLNRLTDLKGAYTGIWWYSNFPEHYAGDARTASAEKGLRLRSIMVAELAGFIAAVKADRGVPALSREFFERSARVTRTE